MLPFKNQKLIVVSPINIGVKIFKHYTVLEKDKSKSFKKKNSILSKIITVPTHLNGSTIIV